MQHVQKTTQESTTAVKDKQEHDLVNLDLRLPTFWNSKDKSKNIDVGSNGIELTYIGPGKQETHAALARSNFPMRPQCGIFYYEMKVISKGEDGYIGIGFCCAENKTERLPGWDVDSWGYHGDDGHSFAGSGIGQNYGPCFTTGDVIGCGVNFADRSAFYTKNGKFLGTAFKQIDVSKPLYPSVGLRTTGEKITTNFGHEPFMFDIEQYIKMISRQSIDRTPYTEYDLNQLVLSYLIHHGYTKTAFAFVKNTKSISDTDQEDTVTVRGTGMEQRTAIRSAIIRGDIDDAIRLIQQHFPKLLDQGERGKSVQLMLKCGKFVEMMREYSSSINQKKDEIFSLLAYHDPYTSPVSHIMSVSRRDALATEVNAAILAFLQQPEIPALERIYRQLILSNKMLAIEGDGTSALVKVEDYYMNHMEKIKMP
ncbi:SPRY-domain-containing protein [Rhizopus microsporus ATCC 52813]|uniref:SPRY-domain-containing protein n=1 Tax=Rhizopus microsporus ATCC 52813 TaxID=1340429 RepID=A0A2G4T3X6_RHIZD|nr:SPRY-domain-containing protein [Rhizopus microsporus ATCC 52813]PHZ15705.1 SPRY-domain-containing protein [Rhizopus microsporus ATCC 52813]